jgi:ribosomal protein S18 acetylase RimI-like enzyme
MSQIKILNYEPAHQPYFEKLNRAWIEQMFEMEPVDEWVVTNPDKAIIDPGGVIIMAECDGVIAGTAGLRKVDEHIYEFTKMAVDKSFRRRGIARAISLACFEKARELGAGKVILYSNKKNEEAIKLYESIGFRHLPVEPGVYKRANVKMTIDIDEAMKAVALAQNTQLIQG